MLSFLQRHVGSVTGSLNGWDRLRFRGTLRMLANRVGLNSFLRYRHVLLKDFGSWAKELSRQVRSQSLQVTEQAGRPVIHLQGSSERKEDLAREIAQRDGIKEGLICTLTALEPCWSYDIRSNRQAGKLELVHAQRKCQHLYHYLIHPVFGFMHLRLQTWLPMNLHVCINGREWLCRQLDSQGIGYLRKENCLAWVADVERAQALLQEQVSHNYAQSLGALAEQFNPAYRQLVGEYRLGYYWSLEESEWATDVMFREQAELDRLYQGLLRHGMGSFASPDVLRFLGHKVLPQNRLPGALKLEVVSDYKQRAEGIRIKHRAGSNSVKMYNKQGTVLRVEATLNDMRQLKAPRIDEKGRVSWEKMRKGVSDIARRAQVSQQITGRYLEQMAAVQTPRPLKELSGPVTRNARWHGRRVRGLDLLGKDAPLLMAAGRGEFLIHGFRNRDLQQVLLGSKPEDRQEQRRRSGQITRKLQLLRAHGLVEKVPRTHRYLLTVQGRELIAALHAAGEADISKLHAAA